MTVIVIISILALIGLLVLILFSAGEREWMRQHKGVCDRYIVPDAIEFQPSGVSLVSIGARLKFWFDLGQSALGIMTFSLLLFGNLDKISSRIHLSGSLLSGLALVALAVIAVIVFGFILDRMNFQQHFNRELNKRNEAISEIHRRVT